MPKFKVGDRVTMSEAGALKWGRNSLVTSNPWGIEGVVETIDRNSDLNIMVKWSNGQSNCYRAGHLDIIYDIFENE